MYNVPSPAEESIEMIIATLLPHAARTSPAPPISPRPTMAPMAITLSNRKIEGFPGGIARRQLLGARGRLLLRLRSPHEVWVRSDVHDQEKLGARAPTKRVSPPMMNIKRAAPFGTGQRIRKPRPARPEPIGYWRRFNRERGEFASRKSALFLSLRVSGGSSRKPTGHVQGRHDSRDQNIECDQSPPATIAAVSIRRIVAPSSNGGNPPPHRMRRLPSPSILLPARQRTVNAFVARKDRDRIRKRKSPRPPPRSPRKPTERRAGRKDNQRFHFLRLNRKREAFESSAELLPVMSTARSASRPGPGDHCLGGFPSAIRVQALVLTLTRGQTPRLRGGSPAG